MDLEIIWPMEGKRACVCGTLISKMLADIIQQS